MKDKTYIYFTLMLLITIIWGAGFPITDIAITNGFSPSHILAGRFLFASIFMSVIFIKKVTTLTKDDLIFGSISGILIASAMLLQITAQVYTTASNAAFISQTMVIMIPFLNLLVYKIKVSMKSLILAITTLTGIFIITISGGEDLVNSGDFIVMGCAVVGSIYMIYNSYSFKIRKLDPIKITIIQFYTAAIIALLFSIFSSNPPSLTFGNYWPLLFLGFLNTGIGFIIQSLCLSKLNANTTSLINSGEALWATLFATLWIGEVLTLNVLIGGTIIIGSIAFAGLEPKKKDDLNKPKS